MSLSETSPFPLAVNKTIGRYITLPISETGLSTLSRQESYRHGSFYVADLLHSPGQLSISACSEFLPCLRAVNWYIGDLPDHPYLIDRLDYNNISPQLANVIKMRLALLVGREATNYHDLGQPTFLALALLPDLYLPGLDIMTSQLHTEFEDLLALRDLRPRMTFEEIFEYRPLTLEEKLAGLTPAVEPGAAKAARAAADAKDLEFSNLLEETARGHNRLPKAYVPLNDDQVTEEQIKLLATPVKDLNLGCEDQLAQFYEVLGRDLTMLHVMVGLLAILPEDRPTELTDWYEKVGVPIQPWPLDDLHRASELIMR